MGSNATAKVKLDELDGIESYWLPVGQYRAGTANTAYWLPQIGELVMVLLDESGSQGCIVCGIYSNSSPSPSNSQNLLAIVVPQTTIDGNLVITGDVQIVGNVDISGNVGVNGSHQINGKSTVVVGSADSDGDTNINSGQ